MWSVVWKGKEQSLTLDLHKSQLTHFNCQVKCSNTSFFRASTLGTHLPRLISASSFYRRNTFTYVTLVSLLKRLSAQEGNFSRLGQ